MLFRNRFETVGPAGGLGWGDSGGFGRNSWPSEDSRTMDLDLDLGFSRISEGTLGSFLPRFFVIFGMKLGGVLLFRNRFETAGLAIILFRRFWGIRPKQLAQLPN